MTGAAPKEGDFQARLDVHQRLHGQGRMLQVRGGLLFRQWDERDEEFYFWEEWQITGLEHYDVWIEFDHDTRKVYLYEPLTFNEKMDPLSLTPGQTLSVSSRGAAYTATVEETGSGVLVDKRGEVTCTLQLGHVMGYVELRLESQDGDRREVTVDTHAFRDIVSYTKQELSVSEQKRMFGATIAPAKRPVFAGVVWVVVVAVMLTAAWTVTRMGGPDHRIGPGSSETSTSQPGGSRPVYGGGGHGVGK